MPELTAPTVRLRESWLSARDEWGRGVHQDGAGLDTDFDLDSPDGFADWIDWLSRQADPAFPLPPGRVPASYWWVTEADTYLGAISLRHELNDVLLAAGGHIGYGIRPSARGRGLATFALRAVLPAARELGIGRVLITCDDTNTASARVISKCGGVLEDVRDTALGRTRRYWIEL